MQRRTVIKRLLIVAGGVVVLPSCLYKNSAASVSYKHLRLTGEDEKWIAEFAETLIPSGKAPGAKDTNAPAFALRMIDDCTEPDTLQHFQKGLHDFKAKCENQYGSSFLNCTSNQRKEIFTQLENKKTTKEDIAVFYNHLKSNIIRGYLNSKPVMGGIFEYKLIPGPYSGSVPLKTIFHPA